MKRTVRDLRLARGLSQLELAELASISQSELSRLENLTKGAPWPVVERLCKALECRPEDLLLAPERKSGGQLKVAADALRLLRMPPPRVEVPDWSSARRLSVLRRDYPQFMRKMEPFIAQSEAFLQDVPSESPDETILHLLELSHGATPVWDSTAGVGFDLWPVCDEDGRGAATRMRPALVTRHWVMFFQVWLIANGKWRLDGLVIVREPQPTAIDVEVDSDFHNPKDDERRRRALGMPTLRIPGEDLLRGPSLTARLQEMGYCLPRRQGRVVEGRVCG